ncbi:MAG: redoxin domain-containing protein [Myxococcales bacterium FL481]|nr:MAG: redoxin domain-containing protein [Myxococcales bacterium FL481]
MVRTLFLIILVPTLFVGCSKTEPAGPKDSPTKATAAPGPAAKSKSDASAAAVVPFLEDALAAVTSGKSPARRDTRPYGCSVKYADRGAGTAVAAKLGEPAPDFELQDLDGKPVKLSSLRGQTIVLEWYNPQCPFVEYAYNEGPLRELAKQHGGHDQGGVVWLNINSSAPGKQGAGVELNRKFASQYKIAHPILLDESGDVGRAYGAKTTPHMYIIDASGTLVYRGGLDNAPFGKVES